MNPQLTLIVGKLYYLTPPQGPLFNVALGYHVTYILHRVFLLPVTL